MTHYALECQGARAFSRLCGRSAPGRRQPSAPVEVLVFPFTSAVASSHPERAIRIGRSPSAIPGQKHPDILVDVFSRSPCAIERPVGPAAVAARNGASTLSSAPFLPYHGHPPSVGHHDGHFSRSPTASPVRARAELGSIPTNRRACRLGRLLPSPPSWVFHAPNHARHVASPSSICRGLSIRRGASSTRTDIRDSSCIIVGVASERPKRQLGRDLTWPPPTATWAVVCQFKASNLADATNLATALERPRVRQPGGRVW